MMRRMHQQVGIGRLGTMALTAVVMTLLFAGFMVVSPHPLVRVSQVWGSAHAAQVASAPPGIPGSFADLAKRLGPTVVNIKVTKVEKASGFAWPQGPEGPFGELFKRFFGDIPPSPERFQTQGAGSGVIISADGFILTNNHVVDGAKEVTVTLADGREQPTRIVGRDPKTDLAVVKIEAKESLPVASLGDSGRLNVGDWVIAIGNPFGLSNTVTSGIVSAKGRVIGAGPYDDFIQTDASINPGNSGGPLFNLEGEVVGINTAIIPYGRGIGFAIPVNVAKPLIPQLETKGTVTRGYLGVSVQSLTPDLSKALKLADRKGALVGDVVSGSPADKAGIRRGDVIVRLDQENIQGAHDLSAMVAKTPVGKDVAVTIFRDGVEQHVRATIGELQSQEAKVEPSAKPAEGRWGLALREMGSGMARQHGVKNDQGVLVADVRDGSSADRAGVQHGDLILEVNGQPVHKIQEVKEALDKVKNGDSALLLVHRGEGSLFVAMAG
jgi:serine protease Do